MNLEDEGNHIKSAREIAMEKVAEMGEVTEEERLGWKYVPEGEKLAARYMNQDINLAAELGNIRAANTLMLGCLSIFIPIQVNIWQECLSRRLPENIRQVNLSAFAQGRKVMKAKHTGG